MPFSFDMPWCLCGKPLQLDCAQPIPNDYFGDLSVDAAKFAHRCHLNETSEKNRSTFTVNANGSFVVDGASWTLYPCPPDVSVVAVDSNNYTYPTCLTSTQSSLLENKNWQGFLQTLDPPLHSCDIIVNRGQRMLTRIFTHNHNDPSVPIQVNVNGNMYISSRNKSCGRCSWTVAGDGGPTHVHTPVGILDVQRGEWSHAH